MTTPDQTAVDSLIGTIGGPGYQSTLFNPTYTLLSYRAGRRPCAG
ncbi:hypothetical protein [Acidisoma cladoniae]|jgi:hypothetical protein|nr:hypothetical protein [Acidisoma sp. PAMC 29798]